MTAPQENYKRRKSIVAYLVARDWNIPRVTDICHAATPSSIHTLD